MTKIAKGLHAETCPCGEHVIIVVEAGDGDVIRASLRLDDCDSFADNVGDLVRIQRANALTYQGKPN